jgi:hypothetical protein
MKRILCFVLFSIVAYGAFAETPVERDDAAATNPVEERGVKYVDIGDYNMVPKKKKRNKGGTMKYVDKRDYNMFDREQRRRMRRIANDRMVGGEGRGFDAEEYGRRAPPARSKDKWYSGAEIGVSSALTLPLSGIGGFVGYADRANDWLGRNIGARLDFQIPLKASGDMKVVNKGADTAGVNTFALLGGSSVYIESDGIKGGDFELEHLNMGGVIDFYPFDDGDGWLGGLRVSAGYYAGRMNIDAIAKCLDGSTDEASIQFRGTYGSPAPGDLINVRFGNDYKFRKSFQWRYDGPYFGVGYELGAWRGIKFFADAGVVLISGQSVSEKSDINLAIDSCVKVSGGNCAVLGGVDIVSAIGSLIADEIENKMNSAAGGTGFSTAQQALFNQYCPGKPSACTNVHDLLKNDLKRFLSSNQDPTTWSGFNASNWLGIVFSTAAAHSPDTMPYEPMLGALSANLNNPSSQYSKAILQQEIDDARAAHENEIITHSEISLKDTKFMPMIKLGVMYRF